MPNSPEAPLRPEPRNADWGSPAVLGTQIAGTESAVGATDVEADGLRQITLLVTGRCRRCAERLPGGVAVRGAPCPSCGSASARTPEEVSSVQALFEARAQRRTWLAVLLAGFGVLVVGWLPLVAGVALTGSFLWVQLALVRPAARLLSARRRIVTVWTFALLGATAVALNVAVVELLTLIPVLGHLGKSATTAVQVALLAFTARRYLGWQVRREASGMPVGIGEYLLLAIAALLITVGATVALSLAFWVTGLVKELVGAADALAAGPALGPAGLEWAALLGLGAATGTRASLVLILSGMGAHFAPRVVPAQLHFLGSPEGLGIAIGLLVVEAATERDDDVQALFGLAAGGARTVAAAFIGVVASGQPAGSSTAMIAGAVGAAGAVAVATARGPLHRILRELETEAFSPRRWLNRLEEGGALGLAVAVYAGPMLAVGLAAAGVAALLAARLVASRVEAKWRRPCRACSMLVRVEASGCPHCGANLEVARSVSAEAIGIAVSAWQAALARSHAAAHAALALGADAMAGRLKPSRSPGPPRASHASPRAGHVP